MRAACALTVLTIAFAGEVLPRITRPIEVTYSNAGVRSNYTFHFKPEQALTSGMRVLIRFPKAEYEEDLGTEKCEAHFAPDLPVACRISGVFFGAEILDDSPTLVSGFYSLTIADILNPGKPCTTGHFVVETLKGQTSVDASDAFARLAVTPALTPMPHFQVDCQHSCRAGDSTSYRLSFALPIAIPPKSWFLLSVPAGFGYNTESFCVSKQWRKLRCDRVDSGMVLRDWNSLTAVNRTIAVEFPMVRNPQVAGFYGHFQITILEEERNTIIIRSQRLQGPVITPNRILIEQLCPNALSLDCADRSPHLIANTLTEFNISGQTTNEIPEGGCLVLNFSHNFGDIARDGCRLLSGLMLESLRHFPVCEGLVGSKSAVICLAAAAKGAFSIQVKVATPVEDEGLVTITSYADAGMTRAIDQTESPVVIGMEKVKRMKSVKVRWSDELVSDGLASFSVILQPRTDFPRGPSGSLRIRVLSSTVLTPASTATLTVCGNITFPTIVTQISTDLIQLPIMMTLRASCEVIVDAANVTWQLPSTPTDLPVEVTLNDGKVDVQSGVQWANVGPMKFREGAVGSLSHEAGDITVLEVSFSPLAPVPRSTPEETVAGLIVLKFPVADELWTQDLGTSLQDGDSLSCREKTNMISASGRSISCQLFKGENLTSIEVGNFNELKADALVQMEVGGIRNVKAVGVRAPICVSTYLRFKGILSPLNSACYELPATLPPQRLTPIEYFTQLSLSPTTVRTSAVLKVDISPQHTRSEDSVVMLIFPDGFMFADTGTSCRLQNRARPCSGFTSSGLLVVTLEKQLESDREQVLTVRGLLTPRHVLPPSSLIVGIYAHHSRAELFYYRDFPSLTSGAVTKASVTVDSTEAGNLDTTYIFIVTMENRLYYGGKIRLVFPHGYHLQTTALRCYVNDIVFGDDRIPGCEAHENTVEMMSLSASENRTLTIKIENVVNPIDAGFTGSFELKTFSEYLWLVDAASSIPGVVITKKSSRGHFTHLSTTLIPNNRQVDSELTVTFLPSVRLPAESIIELHFPKDEFYFSESLGCRLTEGLVLDTPCSRNGSVVLLTTDKAYAKSFAPQKIAMSAQGVRATHPKAVSGDFLLRLWYAGVMLEESTEIYSNRTVAYVDEPRLLTQVSITYSPRSPSEEAIYTLNVRLESELPAGCSLSLRFPTSFRRHAVLRCRSNLSTKEYCIVSNRLLSIPATSMPAGSNVSVTLTNLLNPAPGRPTGPIEVYTMCGITLQDYGVVWPLNTTKEAANPLILAEFDSGSWEVGAETNVSLIVKTVEEMKKILEGMLVVEFAEEFSVVEVECWVFTVPEQCESRQNRISIATHPETLMSNVLEIEITGVRNPWDTKEVAYPIVAIWDAETVVAKTAQSLSVLPPLRYLSTLPTIEVNGNRPWVQTRGTQSEYIYAELPAPASHDFSVQPEFSLPGVTLRPLALHFYRGSAHTYFQISISSPAAAGSHLLQWNAVSEFTVRPLRLEVSAEATDLIVVRTVDSVLQGTVADENYVSLERGPASELILKLEADASVKFVPAVIRFGPGEILKQFSIALSDEEYEESIEFRITKEGIDAAAYILPPKRLLLKVAALNSSPPRLSYIHITNITRTSAVYEITAERPVFLYWIVAWHGTRAPSRQELLSQTFTDPLDAPVYYYTHQPSVPIAPHQYEYVTVLRGLRAGTKYVANLLAVDENNEHLVVFQRFNFSTMPGFRGAYLTYRFTSSGQKENNALLDKAAEILSVKRERLILCEEALLPRSPTQAITASNISATHLHLLLKPHHYDSGPFSPRQRLFSLIEQHAALAAVILGLDQSAVPHPVELPLSVPVWKTEPTIDALAAVPNVLLVDHGVVYICVVEGEDVPSTPTSFQIYRGIDSENKPCRLSRNFTGMELQCSESVLTSLDGGLNYWAFFTAASSLPFAPDLMPDNQVKTVAVPALVGNGLQGFPRLSAAIALTIAGFAAL